MALLNRGHSMSKARIHPLHLGSASAWPFLSSGSCALTRDCLIHSATHREPDAGQLGLPVLNHHAKHQQSYDCLRGDNLLD
ncbi:hypothetical protein P7K49_000578, partial [Saguinus oedipus]